MKDFVRFFVCCLLLLGGLLACEPGGGPGSPVLTPPATPTVGVSPTGASPTTGVATPTVAPVPSVSSSDQALARTATAYYQAIKELKYTQAYTYLASNAIDGNGKRITRESFMQMAQMVENEEGPVISFTVAAFAPMVVMTIERKHIGAYHAHLQMRQEQSHWKIISLDRI